jgi:hypothetical protein
MATSTTNKIAQNAVAKNAALAFMATHYDPYDPRQTKPSGNGIGAFGKKVEWGDVAMGQRKYRQGTLIEIPELKAYKTPYGYGVFRVNDKKNQRYSVPGAGENFDIAVPSSVPNAKELRNRIGKSTMTFRLLNEPAPKTMAPVATAVQKKTAPPAAAMVPKKTVTPTATLPEQKKSFVRNAVETVTNTPKLSFVDNIYKGIKKATSGWGKL